MAKEHIVTQTLVNFDAYDWEGSVGRLVETLQAFMVQEGYSNFRIEYDAEWDGPGSWKILADRPENDKEKTRRLEVERKRKEKAKMEREAVERKERKEYERLRTKFEKPENPLDRLIGEGYIDDTPSDV